ncbi:MAG: prolyl-tRNA synthetase associated domain-containing protein [Candidatus Pacebacteria bacterium]|nr:prolyl-tRNA synthetase associated domain-containing protein [Candidatus Paceibacterota bacterium]
MKDIYKILKDLNIDFEKYEHPPVINAEEADIEYKKLGLDGTRCKNLFLRDRKGKKHFLFVTEAHKEMNLEELGEFLGEKRLGFASPERLEKYLKTKRGSVSLLNLINDENHEVILIVDREVFEAEKASFHPDNNKTTLMINNEGIHKFIKYCGNELIIYG